MLVCYLFESTQSWNMNAMCYMYHAALCTFVWNVIQSLLCTLYGNMYCLYCILYCLHHIKMQTHLQHKDSIFCNLPWTSSDLSSITDVISVCVCSGRTTPRVCSWRSRPCRRSRTASRPRSWRTRAPGSTGSTFSTPPPSWKRYASLFFIVGTLMLRLLFPGDGMQNTQVQDVRTVLSPSYRMSFPKATLLFQTIIHGHAIIQGNLSL